jgi:hypothetical protein
MSVTLDDNEAAVLAKALAKLGTTADTASFSGTLPGAPTIRQSLAESMPLLKENTRRTYRTHLMRIRDGVAPICDQTCEGCDVPVRFTPVDDNGLPLPGRQYVFECRCSCRACRDSCIQLAPLAERLVGPDTICSETFRVVGEAALRIAKKTGAYDNVQRALKGKPNKAADGRGAQETAVAACRWFAAVNSKWVGGYDGLDVKKPTRRGGDRRALLDFELIDLIKVTELGGDDVELDSLLVRLGLQCGSRRCGTWMLTVGALHRHTQIIDICDKGGVTTPMPASGELIDDLLAHAIRRGGSVCDPSSPNYRSDSPVLWQRSRKRGIDWTPLTDRRFDSLAGRWQSEHDWARDEQVGYHHIRHTISERLKSMFGQHYSQRYLRHSDTEVTDRYGRCTLEQLARALAYLFEYEHPLVDGIDARRAATFQRLGLTEG